MWFVLGIAVALLLNVMMDILMPVLGFQSSLAIYLVFALPIAAYFTSMIVSGDCMAASLGKLRRAGNKHEWKGETMKRYLLYIAVGLLTFIIGVPLGILFRNDAAVLLAQVGSGNETQPVTIAKDQKVILSWEIHDTGAPQFYSSPQRLKVGQFATLNWHIRDAATVRVKDVTDREDGVDVVQALCGSAGTIGIKPEFGILLYSAEALDGAGLSSGQWDDAALIEPSSLQFDQNGQPYLTGVSGSVTLVERYARRYELTAYDATGREFLKLHTFVEFETPESVTSSR